jgi:Major capsid protein N-terminus/Large eukaryotic DNA virus major capsid protein
MAGGLLQIVAYGAQDVYLTNDPQITFFKLMYRRHTNFSIQTFEKTFNDNPDFGKKRTVRVFRLGDLATQMYLRVVLNAVTTTPGAQFAWVRRVGHAMLRSIEIVIGGTVIDKQYGTWLDIWYELARQGKHDEGYAKMIGDTDELTQFNDQNKPEYILFIPFQFWFNRHIGAALPLIAIQYHEISVNVELESNTKLIVRNAKFTNFTAVKILEMGLMTTYVYLDDIERRKFATVGHEYLIELVQLFEENEETDIKRLKLPFSFPTKELIWAVKNGNYTSGETFLCYCNKPDWSECIVNCSIEVLLQSMLLLPAAVIETIPTIDQSGTNFKIISEVDQSGSLVVIIPGIQPPNTGLWIEFPPGTINGTSPNGLLTVTNNSTTNSLWININSLLIGTTSITSTISAVIQVTVFNTIIVTQLNTGLSEVFLSIPVTLMDDTRVTSDNVIVYQFINYGLLITGNVNPLTFAMLEYNGANRCERRSGTFFGYLQPYIHHSNTPADGINLYSFAIFPEKLQPSGTSNLSAIENIILTLEFGDSTGLSNYVNIFGLNNRLFIFAYSYNVFRVISGLTGLAYDA